MFQFRCFISPKVNLEFRNHRMTTSGHWCRLFSAGSVFIWFSPTFSEADNRAQKVHVQSDYFSKAWP